jgi:hypothetical protein
VSCLLVTVLMSALAPVPDTVDAGQVRGPKRRGRSAAMAATAASAAVMAIPAAAAADASARADSPPEPSAEPDPDALPAAGRASPADRRRGATALLDVWRDTARDLALVELGDVAGLHDPDMLEELTRLVARWPAGASGRFLARLDRAGQLLDANANPELTADVLALAWPRAARAA